MLPSRIARKIGSPTADGCWPWMAVVDRHGYGQIAFQGSMKGAHRVVYQLMVGPVPRHLHLDHLCRNPRCVNPLHLEVVTPAENARRGLNGVLCTHCPRGHPYNTANMYVDSRGKRTCRSCNRIAVARYKARKDRR